MTGFGVFLGKELLEIRRTWRIWVIPGLTVFFAITSPLLALFTPELLRLLATSDPGMVIQMPDPTAREAFGQFLQNMGQIVMIAMVIAGASSVSSERSSGTAILALTKPLSRPAFILAKVASQQILLIVSTALGTAVTIGVTAALFDRLPVRAFVTGVALWLAFALFFIAVMTLCSVLFRSRGGAAGAGLFVLFSTLIASAFPLIAKWTFAGLPTASTKVLMGQSPSVLWPLVTAGVGMVGASALAVGAFRKKEI